MNVSVVQDMTPYRSVSYVDTDDSLEHNASIFRVVSISYFSEVGNGTVLRNVCCLPVYTALHPRKLGIFITITVKTSSIPTT
jgi:hypothetical protein